MAAVSGVLARHPVAVAVAACIVAPVAFPLILVCTPLLLSAVAALLLWRLLCQQSGGQLAQTYQHSPLERIVPLSYPAQPVSDGSSPPSSPGVPGQTAFPKVAPDSQLAAADLSKLKDQQPERRPVKLPSTAQAPLSAAGITELNSYISGDASGGSAAPPATGGASILARLR